MSGAGYNDADWADDQPVRDNRLPRARTAAIPTKKPQTGSTNQTKNKTAGLKTGGSIDTFTNLNQDLQE